MTTEIKIQDEPTRRAVLFALWDHASSAIRMEGYKTLPDLVSDCALAEIGLRWSDEAPVEELEQALVTVQAARAAIEEVRGAGVGELVDVPLTAEQLRTGLLLGQRNIAEYEQFWSAEPEHRRQVLAAFEGMVNLLASVPAEAVA